MSDNNIPIEEVVEEKITGYEERGNTVILVAIDGEYLIIIHTPAFRLP